MASRQLNAEGLLGVYYVMDYGRAIGDGVTPDDAALKAADRAAVNAGGATVVVANQHRVSANLTMTSPVLFLGNGQVLPDTGVTVTLNGPIDAGPDQIFGGAGTVTITNKVPKLAEWWGAVGNGVADDTTAVQAGLNGGGILRLIDGATYLINTQTAAPSGGIAYGLAVPSNTLIDGGSGATLKQGFALTGLGTNALLQNSTPLTGNTTITLRNVTLLTPVVTGTSPNLATYGEAIWFLGCSNVLLDACTVTNGTVSARPLLAQQNTASVNTTGLNHYWTVRGCTFSNGAEALAFLQGIGLIFVGNTCLHAYDSTISINSSGEQIVIADNVLDSKSNTFAGSALIELSNDGAGDTNGIRDVTISGNLLLNTLYATEKGIQILNCRNVTISGNTARNLAYYAIYISNGSRDITITGNVADTCEGGLSFPNDGAGNANVTISGNSFLNSTGTAMLMGGASATYGTITITGNTISGSTLYGINLAATATTNGAISGNVISGNTSGQISQAGSTGWQIHGNPGYNPVGGAVTQPAVPASGTPLTNTTSVDCTVYVNGGTVSAIAVGGTATGITATGHAVRVVAGQTITLTYSSAPTWVWIGD